MTSLDVHQFADSSWFVAWASRLEDLQMKEKSRKGLTERPRCWTEEVRLLERKSEPRGTRVVVEEEVDVGMGLETTRLRGKDGGRMVETEPPRERTDWED